MVSTNATVPHTHAHDVRKMGQRCFRTASRRRHPLFVRYGAPTPASCAHRQGTVGGAQTALETVTAIDAAMPDGCRWQDGALSRRAGAVRRRSAPPRGSRRGHQTTPEAATIEDAGLSSTAQVGLPDSALTRRRAVEGGDMPRPRRCIARILVASPRTAGPCWLAGAPGWEKTPKRPQWKRTPPTWASAM